MHRKLGFLIAGIGLSLSDMAQAEALNRSNPTHMEYGRYSSVVIVYQNCRVIEKANYEIARDRRAALRKQIEAQGVTDIDEFDADLKKQMLQYGCGPFLFSDAGKAVIEYSKTFSQPDQPQN